MAIVAARILYSSVVLEEVKAGILSIDTICGVTHSAICEETQTARLNTSGPVGKFLAKDLVSWNDSFANST